MRSLNQNDVNTKFWNSKKMTRSKSKTKQEKRVSGSITTVRHDCNQIKLPTSLFVFLTQLFVKKH